MSCSRLWDRCTLSTLFSRCFVFGALKFHREQVLFEHEKSLMPGTQRRAKYEKRILESFQLRNDFTKKDRHFKLTPEYGVLDKLTREIHTRYYQEDPIIKKKKPSSTDRCPCCPGFLNSLFKCGLCSVPVCKACHEVLTDTHKCDPDVVASVAAIRADTKGCPTCGTRIFRTEGCPQMWCPDCHTTFDWNTGEIETGSIHNPHYYEYMRSQPGGVPRAVDRCHDPDVYGLGRVAEAVQRFVRHVRAYNLNLDPWKRSPLMTHCRDDCAGLYLRVQFMVGTLSEKQFKHEIQKLDKSTQKRRDCNNVLVMMCDVCTDLLFNLIETGAVNEFEGQIGSLFEYTNGELCKIGAAYNNKAMVIKKTVGAMDITFSV